MKNTVVVHTHRIFVPTEIPLKFLTVRVFVFSLLIIHIFVLCDCSFKFYKMKKNSYIFVYMAILHEYIQHTNNNANRVLLLHIST